MYHPFTYYTPTKVVFGEDTENQAGQLVRSFGGTKVLIVYGSDRILKNGLMDRVTASLDQAGISHVSIGGVVPNPLLSLVYKAIDLGRENGIDFILAIGGGSVIDTAKATAYGLANDGDVWDLYARTRQAKDCLPIGTILTIAAAGSEMSNSSVITKDETLEKRSYNDDISRPRFAVMNPALTLGLPDWQTMSGCTDMMMHTMERYFCNGGTLEITDSLAEALLRTVITNARILHADPQNRQARAEVMWAGSLAHNNLTGCGNDGGDFMSHMLEHELGGMFNVTHGAGLAAIWASWARYVYKDCLPRFVRYAVHVMGVAPQDTQEATALKGIEAMEDFYRSIGMPTNMRELGIAPTEAQILEMAHSCYLASGGPKGSAKLLNEADMAQIYRMAL